MIILEGILPASIASASEPGVALGTVPVSELTNLVYSLDFDPALFFADGAGRPYLFGIALLANIRGSADIVDYTIDLDFRHLRSPSLDRTGCP